MGVLPWLRAILGLEEDAPPSPPPARQAPAVPPEPPPVEDEAVEPTPPSPETARPPQPGRTIHVHADRLDDRPPPRRLTPSEALRLANEGPGALEER